VGAKLHRARLDGANLAQADLSQADLRGADLTDAGLEGSTLRGADLSAARVDGARFAEALVDGVRAFGADLSRAGLDDEQRRAIVGGLDPAEQGHAASGPAAVAAEETGSRASDVSSPRPAGGDLIAELLSGQSRLALDVLSEHPQTDAAERDEPGE